MIAERVQERRIGELSTRRYSNKLRTTLRIWIRDEFVRRCRESDACKKLSRLRRYFWYHDPLLYSMRQPSVFFFISKKLLVFFKFKKHKFTVCCACLYSPAVFLCSSQNRQLFVLIENLI